MQINFLPAKDILKEIDEKIKSKVQSISYNLNEISKKTSKEHFYPNCRFILGLTLLSGKPYQDSFLETRNNKEYYYNLYGNNYKSYSQNWNGTSDSSIYSIEYRLYERIRFYYSYRSLENGLGDSSHNITANQFESESYGYYFQIFHNEKITKKSISYYHPVFDFLNLGISNSYINIQSIRDLNQFPLGGSNSGFSIGRINSNYFGNAPGLGIEFKPIILLEKFSIQVPNIDKKNSFKYTEFFYYEDRMKGFGKTNFIQADNSSEFYSSNDNYFRIFQNYGILFRIIPFLGIRVGQSVENFQVINRDIIRFYSGLGPKNPLGINYNEPEKIMQQFIYFNLFQKKSNGYYRDDFVKFEFSINI